MEGLGIAANVVAVVDLSAKIATLCVDYSKGVKTAIDNIARLRVEVVGLQSAASGVGELLRGPSGERLKASQQLYNTVRHSELQLQAVYERLRPKTGREALARLGLRAFKWPLQGKEAEEIVRDIGRHAQAMNLALQVDQTDLLVDLDRRTVLARLENEVAKGASYDSRAEEHNPTCLRDTRVELLQQISEWAFDPGAEAVFWLNGMAGTGKSTISRTVAHNFAGAGHLGASFFFKRGETDRGSMFKFVSTIAADLTRNVPAIARHVKDAIDGDPAILRKSMREQFDKLIWHPMSLIPADWLSREPIVIIVDALDECERDDDIKLMIDIFSRARTVEMGRLKVFLTSRPELPIRLGFKAIEGKYQDYVLHDMPQPMAKHDICVFLRTELARIRDDYNTLVPEDRQLASDWPGSWSMEVLVEMAFPLFIFAATVCRFIADRRIGTPDEQLHEVLHFRTTSQESQLDATYLPVLTKLITGVTERQRTAILQQFRNTVGPIVILASPLSTSALARLLDIPKNVIDNRLELLHSVLSIPTSADAPVRLLHLSFRDFLLDPEKCQRSPFWIDEKQTHEAMAMHCLRVMSCLRQDICNVKDPGTHRSDIDAGKIVASLPPEVQYACLSWVYHVQGSGGHAGDCEQVLDFLKRHFLHWIESLSLLGRARESVHLVGALQSLYKYRDDKQLTEFLDDAMRFILANTSSIESAPLQIYSSLLVFSPRTSKVRTTFIGEIPRWVSLQPKVNDNWGLCMQTIEAHDDWVMSVAFSPNSALVASGSGDRTIRLWRVATGECVHTLKGHKDGVTSVAFSADSVVVASGSSDRTIRLWRLPTGQCMQTLKGHKDGVTSVAFSADSGLVASSSNDKTIRLWRMATGEYVRTFEGHAEWVRSVAFSPDSTLVASGSYDRTIRVWHVATGECAQTLYGHDGSVNAVAFSPDSALVASGSYDKSIRLWRATGECMHTLGHHDKWVTSVAFSSDSALVASGSTDRTIRLWRISTGNLVQTLEGHDGSVVSAAFSPDSSLIASGSTDRTIRLWHISMDEFVQTLEGHTDGVTSVAFSPNSAIVASGSDDKTIRLWRVTTGRCVQTLQGHDKWVTSLSFSPDSALVASGSYDCTIRLWRVATGECMQTLGGHDGSVTSVTFSPDSTLVASGSHDCTIRLWRITTCECVQTLNVGFASSRMAFEYGNSRLLTDRGAIPTQVEMVETSLTAPLAHAATSTHSSFGISEQKSWITWHGKNLFWLPREYRPSASAVSGSIIALGCGTGRVILIGYSRQALSESFTDREA